MKIRQGFVSNSSSSSYVLGIRMAQDEWNFYGKDLTEKSCLSDLISLSFLTCGNCVYIGVPSTTGCPATKEEKEKAKQILERYFKNTFEVAYYSIDESATELY